MSAFQRAIRGSCTQLTEHICKTMNELNLERCRLVVCEYVAIIPLKRGVESTASHPMSCHWAVSTKGGTLHVLHVTHAAGIVPFG